MQMIFFRLRRRDDKEAARQAVPPVSSQEMSMLPLFSFLQKFPAMLFPA
jgi:hypothetical protein